jgi:endonuclease YncB( thermonuclease family)
LGKVVHFRRRRFKASAMPSSLPKFSRSWRLLAQAPWPPLVILLLVAGLLWLATAPQHQTEHGEVRFTLCHRASTQNCVIDGDTFRYRGETIRILDIDAPETRDFKCASEAALGNRATDRLLELLNADTFSLRSSGRDVDRYGRKLRTVVRNGGSLGDILIAEGLARRWDGARRSWCHTQ